MYENHNKKNGMSTKTKTNRTNLIELGVFFLAIVTAVAGITIPLCVHIDNKHNELQKEFIQLLKELKSDK